MHQQDSHLQIKFHISQFFYDDTIVSVLVNQRLVMTQKFNYKQYTVCVNFSSDTCLQMMVSLPMTNEHFQSQSIELTKIKKDTVIATLGKKNQKALTCSFNMLDVEPRRLIVRFVVSFDFLPEFYEEITLQQIQMKQESFNKISELEFQTQITQMESILDTLNAKGNVLLRSKGFSVSQKTSTDNYDLEKGSYLLQISGIATCASNISEMLEFIFEVEGQPTVKFQVLAFCQYGYSYPFSVNTPLKAADETKVGVYMKVKSGNLCTVSNYISTLTVAANAE